MKILRALVLFSFITLLTGILPAYSQSDIDSLQKVLEKSRDYETRLELMIDISELLLSTDIEKSLIYAETAYKMAESESDESGTFLSCFQLAKICYIKSDLNRAMAYAIKAKELAIILDNPLFEAQSMDAIGSIYYDIGNKVKSSENFYASLKIYESLKDKQGLGSTLCRIGTLYLEQKEYDKATQFFKKSISYAEEIKSVSGIASNLNNLAKVYSETEEYDKALQNYSEALKINLKNKNIYLAANNYLNIADVYLKLKQYEKAEENINKSTSLFSQLGNNLRKTKGKVLLSQVLFESGQYDKCKELTEKVLGEALNLGYKEVIANASGILSDLYLKNADSATAFKYYKLEKEYTDSLFLDEKQKTLTQLELKYQFEKNEQELKLAQQRKNIVIMIISAVLLFSVIIIFLILKQLRLKARKLELEKESHEQQIEFKNKEMVLNVMSLMKKNEMLADLSEKLVLIEQETTAGDSKETIRKVAREIQKSQEEEIWKEFSLRFKEVHGQFYDKLLKEFPALTPNELKLCAFLRLNLSSKDIAELTGQRINTLETARYRLRQKLGIVNSDTNLVTFLSSL